MNLHAVRAIYRFEMARTRRTLLQSIVSPVISTSLYFVVFGAAIGSRIQQVGGVSYGSFIVPGLIMLSLLTQSISNASFGIYFPKFTGTIYELLSAPVSYFEIVVSYVGAAAALIRTPAMLVSEVLPTAGDGTAAAAKPPRPPGGIASDASRGLPQRLTDAFLRGRVRIRAGKRRLRLYEGVPKLDERVTGDEMRLRRERGRRLGLPDRAEALLQLQHDALGGLLADARDCLEARRVLECDRTAQLVGRGAGHDCERDLRADALDGEQQREELPLGRLGEAEELQGILAHVQIGLEHDLAPRLGLPPGAVGGVDEVADTADVENDAVRRARDDLPAKPRDHELRLGARPDGPA
jgi:hypothetical protein